MIYHGPSMGGSGWLWLSFIALALIALAVTALVAAIGPQTRTHAQSPAPAEQVLADRLAHGDIDSEEYQQRLRTLRAARQ